MDVDFTSEEFLRDPYPVYARLRAEKPVAAVKGGFSPGALLLTRYEDVAAALKDPRFSSEKRKVHPRHDRAARYWMPGIFKAFMNSMVMVDDPDHARLRNLVHRGFTGRSIQRLEGRVEAISHELLDRAAAKGEIDLIREFALPLPLTVISEMMGVPLEERDTFHRTMGTFLDATSAPTVGKMLMQLPGALKVDRFFRRLIESRRRDPRDDLVTTLVQAEEAGDRLSQDELVAMLFLLLLAGHETTVNLIGNGTLALLQHPEQVAQLRGEPALMESAIEEMLRYTNPVQHIAPRYTLEEAALPGGLIPARTQVMISIASANRDERVFEAPERFDIARSPNRHVAFGFGIHYCLGAPLARLEGQVAFRILLERYPELRLAQPAAMLPLRGMPALRGLRALPVRLEEERRKERTSVHR